ncbi:MAG: MaoC like domain [Acidimicrobiaceae bacterium]|jgi:acyl dehydratase|nr:MaoC like domain [Acidimicrobiaceae bacterium]
MTVRIDDVELGDELPEERPDVSLETVRRFVKAAQMDFPRFTDHEAARAEGLPGAVIPGIMSQGQLAAMIHRWAPGCSILRIDTLFRTPMIVGTTVVCRGAVTGINDDDTIEIDLTITSDESGATGVLGTAHVRLAG